jgi:hypothetical protein
LKYHPKPVIPLAVEILSFFCGEAHLYPISKNHIVALDTCGGFLYGTPSTPLEVSMSFNLGMIELVGRYWWRLFQSGPSTMGS